MKVKIKKLSKNAILPTKGTEYSAGYDLYSAECMVIYPQDNRKIHTGIAMEIPEGYFGAIFPRSGLATKNGLRLANCVGVIDSDYRGELIVALHNDKNGDEVQIINTGDRIAQLVLIPYLSFDWEEVEELNDTDRGDGGFGSTGAN